MPDITMCAIGCEKQSTCKRHPASGTVPSQRQAWATFGMIRTEIDLDNCQFYWPKEEEQ